mmetsp:Transcript_37744/g.120298  ORF Transcript_37744/g.120298 Transcript_37744/m.120298 type:complete len:641 (-) Transcript_37744:155-2077(-)
MELEEMKQKHDRALRIAQEVADLEVENFRKAHAGEAELTKLVEQVKGSVSEVGRMSKRVEQDKGLEWTMRERQLEAREQNVREMEGRMSAQTKEVEEQRMRVSELVRQMQDHQVDDRSILTCERERLETEHKRLLELQRTVKDTDRGNRDALKHAWAQVEEARRAFEQKQIKADGETSERKEDAEVQERRIEQEKERLKALHNQVEVARLNASRRIRETEATIANERRCLMNDLEIFEEKRRMFMEELQKLDCERKTLEEGKSCFEREVYSVGLMAAEVQKRSEELRLLHEQAEEARMELTQIRGAIQEERSAQGTELDRLKTMQTLIEQQRLQLLQTENQLRIRGVEDMDVMVTTQASFPYGGRGFGHAPMEQQQLALGGAPPGSGPCGGDLFGGYGAAEPGWGASGYGFPGPAPQSALAVPWAATGPGAAEPMWMPGGMPQPLPWMVPATQQAPAPAPPASQLQSSPPRSAPSRREPAPCPARNFATPLRNLGPHGGNRMELQTLLQRTRQSSGEMQTLVQQSYRMIQQDPSMRQQQPGFQPSGARQPSAGMVPNVMRAGPGMGRSGGGYGGQGYLEDWPGPMPPSSDSSGSLMPTSWGPGGCGGGGGDEAYAYGHGHGADAWQAHSSEAGLDSNSSA